MNTSFKTGDLVRVVAGVDDWIGQEGRVIAHTTMLFDHHVLLNSGRRAAVNVSELELIERGNDWPAPTGPELSEQQQLNARLRHLYEKALVHLAELTDFCVVENINGHTAAFDAHHTLGHDFDQRFPS